MIKITLSSRDKNIVIELVEADLLDDETRLPILALLKHAGFPLS